ncbi:MULTISPECIES: aroma-sacti cluster domain-containing protein [unclassified Streptomyces]|uniref:aroma-sacti cluster domain-containing protein n=1 Tax=unclassified Streptomyces TaxID=2593676 RepID=UPI002E2C732C|nr:aroma-sacti cluster domain-containing protein [Streptomyces sp. NBC_00223]
MPYDSAPNDPRDPREQRDPAPARDQRDPHDPNPARDQRDPEPAWDPHDPDTPDRVHPLDALADAGFPVAGMPPEQRAVLAALTPAETDVLLEIKRRLDDSEPEVLAHEAGLIGGLFF